MATALTTYGDPPSIVMPRSLIPGGMGDADDSDLFRDGVNPLDLVKGASFVDDTAEALRVFKEALHGDIPETMKGLGGIAADQAGLSGENLLERLLGAEEGNPAAQNMAPRQGPRM